MLKSRGRPKQQNQQRHQRCCQQRLLSVAKRLFLQNPYDKVTTRRIAEEAEVDVALINYYFNNKSGLYTAIFEDIYAPFFEQLNKLSKDSANRNTIEELFMTIFHLDIEHPELLGIIYKTLVLNDGPRRSYIDQSILQQTDRLHIKIFSALQHKGFIDASLDPVLLKDSFNALVMMPFIFAPQSRGFTEPQTVTYLENLYRHNIRLFLYGCATQQP